MQFESQIEQLTRHYVERIRPIEDIAEAISMQNAELRQLKQKLIKSGQAPKLTSQEEFIRTNQRDIQRQEHRKWTEESITRLTSNFDTEFTLRKKQLEEQIRLKLEETMMTTVGKYNLSTSLENGLTQLQMVIDKLEPSDLKTLSGYLEPYMGVLIKIQNFVEAQEVEGLLRRIKLCKS